MPTGEELDAMINGQIDEETESVIGLCGRRCAKDGRKTESPEIVGTVAECGFSGCVSGENVLEN